MLHSLQDWLVDWADSPAGPAMLALFSAAEAIFFPIPPDPLLIALALRDPNDALLLAGLTTAASTGGGVIGHLLGRRVGRPILQRFHSRQVERVEQLFVRHGFWAIVLAGLTPLPYKVFTVAAGVFDVPRLPFVLASIVGRGVRFGGIGVLIFFWGDRFQQFLDERFDLIMLSMGALLLLAVAIWAVWARRNGSLAPGS
ncbi:MAG: YqaA family protein [Dehalococcoidia bacterium]|jgi:undecaprenyl-diphosphatase|nr:YqaA family protein [Dehalococcoidia bacterium]